LPNISDKSVSTYLRHRWILLRWRRWAWPLLCAIPYLGSIFWLIDQGLLWVAMVLLAPLGMALALIFLTWLLARFEFRGPIS